MRKKGREMVEPAVTPPAARKEAAGQKKATGKQDAANKTPRAPATPTKQSAKKKTSFVDTALLDDGEDEDAHGGDAEDEHAPRKLALSNVASLSQKMLMPWQTHLSPFVDRDISFAQPGFKCGVSVDRTV